MGEKYSTTKKIIKFFIWLLVILTILPFILLAVFQIPQVQSYARNKATGILSDKLKTRVSIDYVSVGLWKDVTLKGIYLEDRNKDTLLYAEELDVNISLLKLLQKKISVSHVRLANGYLNAYRSSGQKDYNYDFIIDAFADTTSGTASPWKFELQSVGLEQIRLRYHDLPAGTLIDSKLETASVDFKTLGIEDNHLVIRKAYVEGMKLALKFQKPEPLSPGKATASSASVMTFTLEELKLLGSSLSYNNYMVSPVTKGLDVNHMNLSGINGSFKDLTMRGTDVALRVDQLSLKERSGLELRDIAGTMNMTKSDLGLNIEKFSTPYSDMQHLLSLHIPLGKNPDIGRISVEGNLQDEKLAIRDLYYFMPDLDTLQMLRGKTLAITGNVKGMLNDFTAGNLSLVVDKQTALRGDFAIRGMLNFRQAMVHAKIRDLRFNATLLRPFVSEQETGIKVTALGNVRVRGDFNGSITNPEMHLTATSNAGNISVNGVLHTDTSFKSLAYEGTVSADKADLQKLLVRDLKLGQVTMNARLTAKNREISSIDAHIASLGYNNYTYRDIHVKGNMLDQVLNMDLNSGDQNLHTDLKIKADLNHGAYSFSGSLWKADLYALHWMNNPFSVQAGIEGNASGKNIDILVGNLKLSGLVIDNSREKYSSDSLLLVASLKEDIHTIELKAPEISASLSGKFRMEELPLVFTELFRNYQSSGYVMKDLPGTSQLDFAVETGDVSMLARMLAPEISVLDSINMKGTFRKEGKKVEVTASVKDMIYAGKEIKKTSAKLSGEDGFLNFSLGTASLSVNENVKLTQILTTGTFSNDIVGFNVKVYDTKAPTRASIDGILAFNRDSVYLNLPSAEIFVNGKQWRVNRSNSITYAPDYLTVEDLELNQAEQKIIINTRLTRSDNVLTALFEKINLKEMGELAGFSSYRMRGRLNGKVTVTDPVSTQGVNASLRIDSLGLNDLVLGTLTASGMKRPSADALSLNAVLEGLQNHVSLTGELGLAKDAPLGMKLQIERLALDPLEPLARTFAYLLKGNVSGNFTIGGTNSAPVVTGELVFNGPNRIGINLTHTVYKVDDQKIFFTPSAIEFRQFTIKDTTDSKAIANGLIRHQGFKDLNFGLNLSANNFQLINSGFTPDVLVYGRLFTRMNVALTGPLEDLAIDLDMTTLKGSRLFVPLASARPTVITPEYVHFHAIESLGTDTLAADKDSTLAFGGMKAPALDLSRFDVRGNIRITEDAEINIVIDPLNGDKITARGNGSFALHFDSQNNINLYGVYTIASGSYGFSFVNLVKKNFTLEKGGTISWTGDFENASMNITAVYETRASRFDLVASQSDFLTKGQIDAAKRPLPVQVMLDLTGRLMTPEISFRIRIPEGTDPSGGIVTQQVNQINNNPNEVSKQAFSLIVLNKFMTTTGSGGSAGGGNIALNEVNQSVSRVLNSQLNELSEDYLQGVDISVNIQSLDQSYGQLAQNAQVNVTKKINDRISVSAGGNVNINSNYGSGQFAGDYNVYYRVNPSGSINLKFFRTSTQSIYTNNLTNQSGFSVSYKREFSRWSRLFRRRKDNRNGNQKG